MAPPAAAVSASKAASSGASLTARRAAMDIASVDLVFPSRQFARAKSVSQKSALRETRISEGAVIQNVRL
jgi:hypothetical protein